jgi:hypothetical protein
MTKLNILIILSCLLALKTAGQVKINKPVNIPVTGQFDSIRLVASKLCIGDTITNSKANFDLRIYRFMAFGDYKIIRISTCDRYNFKADVYSLNRGNDSLIYHKTFYSWGTGLKLKEVVNKYDILNVADLDYEFVTANSLPRTNDGNIYKIEAKVGRNFTYKQFDNPEVYAKHFTDKTKQAIVFADFIKQLEKILDIKISEPEI